DHHGGVATGPALGEVGAARLLAHRGEAMPAQDGPRLGNLRRGRRQAHADPVGLLLDRRVGLVRLLGVARTGVEDGDHGLRKVAGAGWKIKLDRVPLLPPPYLTVSLG